VWYDFAEGLEFYLGGSLVGGGDEEEGRCDYCRAGEVDVEA
jgi:hypothetical protein